jgi:hypothetical protein
LLKKRAGLARSCLGRGGAGRAWGWMRSLTASSGTKLQEITGRPARPRQGRNQAVDRLAASAHAEETARPAGGCSAWRGDQRRWLERRMAGDRHQECVEPVGESGGSRGRPEYALERGGRRTSRKIASYTELPNSIFLDEEVRRGEAELRVASA